MRVGGLKEQGEDQGEHRSKQARAGARARGRERRDLQPEVWVQGREKVHDRPARTSLPDAPFPDLQRDAGV